MFNQHQLSWAQLYSKVWQTILNRPVNNKELTEIKKSAKCKKIMWIQSNIFLI